MVVRGARRAAVLAAVTALAACGAPASATHSRGPVVIGALGSAPSLAGARDLGPIDAATPVHLGLTLRGRDRAGLDALLASGARVGPAEYARRFGPDPGEASRLVATLAAARLTGAWRQGDTVMSVDGPAGDVQRFFGTSLHEYALAGGQRYHAPVGHVAVPAAIAGAVTTVTGLDNAPARSMSAIRDSNGVSPADMVGFYDASPLRNAHIDGTGMTIVFPDWSVPDKRVFDSYAQKFGLPPFDVQVVTSPSWGAPVDPNSSEGLNLSGETSLDVEVAHGIAPGAKEVIAALGDPSKLPTLVQDITKQFPGSIISSSISAGSCEYPGDTSSDANSLRDVARQLDQVSAAAAAQGETIFFASGDRGAFECIPSGDNTSISINPDSAGQGITGVGGTTVFLASNGQYGSEAAWGEPAETWGTGGGVSTLFPRPTWQKAAGLDPAQTHRTSPDVAANADIVSGWDVFSPDGQNPGGSEGAVGGTSAATPFWAAVTALLDQDLKSKSLPTVGFFNPILYFLASNPSGLPAPPFHDITVGSNLHDSAGAGYDLATGLGSPEVSALADDLEWYQRNHPKGAGT